MCPTPLPDNAVCKMCEADNCPSDPIGCSAGTCTGQPGCSDYQNPADQALCQAVINCVRKSNCHAPSALSCFCGTADATACAAVGGANGVCKAEIEAGFKNTDPTFIRTNLLLVSLPGGGALNLLQCDRDFCGNSGGRECVPYCK